MSPFAGRKSHQREGVDSGVLLAVTGDAIEGAGASAGGAAAGEEARAAAGVEADIGEVGAPLGPDVAPEVVPEVVFDCAFEHAPHKHINTAAVNRTLSIATYKQAPSCEKRNLDVSCTERRQAVVLSGTPL